MINLDILKNARTAYEDAFASRGYDIDRTEDRFNDRELLLSGHVFVANIGNRRIQITLAEEGIPCAFFKKMGVNDEVELLQIIVEFDEIMIDQCADLYRDWIIHRLSAGNLQNAVSEFAK